MPSGFDRPVGWPRSVEERSTRPGAPPCRRPRARASRARARAPRGTARATSTISRVGRADRERPRHVREETALDVAREEVADDVVVVGEPARALVVAVGGLRAVRGDQVVAAAAVRGERRDRRLSEALARERLAVRRRVPRHPARSGRAARRSPPSPPRPRARPRRMPSSSSGVFRRRRSSKSRWSTVELDAVRTERVGVPQRERRRARRASRTPSARAMRTMIVGRDLVVVDAVPHRGRRTGTSRPGRSRSSGRPL